MSGAVAAILMAVSGAPGVIQDIIADNGVGAFGLTLVNDGTETTISSGSSSWLLPNSSVLAALYQVKTVVNSGSFTADPSAGSYIDCSSNRTWNRASPGTVNFTITFREKASGIVRHTQTLSCVAS